MDEETAIINSNTRNEKIKNTDEFLIKKKEPLTQPPDFDKIPEPGSEREVKTKQSDFEKMIQNTKEEWQG